MRIHRLVLETAVPDELADFYGGRLGLPVSRDERGFSVTIGRTEVEFSETNAGEPFYHFAINIPKNRFDAARDWLADRVGLLPDVDSGETEFYFEFMNAHATYFEDPAGNIGELIARHDLDDATDGPDEAFDSDCLLEVSEIGLPVREVPSAVETIESHTDATGWESDSETFRVVGDDHGMFVLVREGRDWFVSGRPAGVFPTEIVIEGSGPGYEWPDLPYRIDIR